MMNQQASLNLAAFLSSSLVILCGAARLVAQDDPKSIGIFEQHRDIGTVLHAGSVEYDASKRTYTIAGSGENMWFTSDAFQFVWKKVSGDVRLTAEISFIGSGGDPHRKAALMIRQSLDADSAYADVAFHGVGLTSLQSRTEKAATTHEVQAAINGPKRLRIEKRGKSIYMFLSAGEGEPQFSGASMELALDEPFYVGLGVCAHNKDAVETAGFSNVELTPLPAASGAPVLYSTLEIIAVASTDRRVSYVTKGRITAPEWSKDGAALLFTRDGRLERIPVDGRTPEPAGTPSPKLEEKDGSPDGKQVVSLSPIEKLGPVRLSLRTVDTNTSRVLAAFVGGPGSLGQPWSPDGRRLVFVSYHYLP